MYMDRLGISENPYRRLVGRLRFLSESGKDIDRKLFEMRNEVFIAYYEQLQPDVIRNEIEYCISEQAVKQELFHFLKILEKRG